ncbi:interleukin-27 receptor subunit alpha isoform X1 [Phyllostomus hastatus]|uniref:interleukin-27 receptor subunit alpha isoform X1 n=3 Tax=Phyllostomus hastatus TaxID=9423 RepID=UPI001E681F66|nr:interleukin-27 receptor subunit alpha isoform X1 [Phyllostomus hastatus]
MRWARAAPFVLLPKLKLALLPLLLLLFHRTSPHGSPRPLRCYGVGPLGDLNCSWESLGDLRAPSMLHLQSQKYHSNRTWTVAVPTGQSWVTIPREQFTTSDELLVWGAKAGRPLWSPVFVNLETQMKPEAPQLDPDVDFSEDDPLEATVQWSPPSWPPHKVLVCQFHYRRCQQMAWILLEPELKSIPLTPVEIQDLELATGYEVSGRCRMEKEEDLWGEWSPILSFQTLPSAPKDVWISGNLCGTQGGQKSLLLWKAPGHCVQASYRVWFQVKGQELIPRETPCCSSSIPTQTEWVAVSAINATSWEPLTNLSLICLDSGSAPHGVVVSSIAGSTELLVTWQQGSGEPKEHVVDWAQDGEPLENLSWVRLPPGNLSAVLQGHFEGGVPYRITVTAVSPGGLYPAPSVWSFREELAPLVGPVLWRLQDAPPGTPTIAWGEVPRHQLRGLLTHYTLCAQSGTRPSVCMNVSGSAQKITLPNLPWGPCELWMTASTIAGQGPPGPSLRLHLPDNTLKLKILPVVVLLWGLFLTCCGISLATSGRCLHLRHKVLPRWVWEKVPDPANSNSSKPHVEEIPQAQPPRDSPTLEVEEIEPLPVVEHPQASSRLDSGYEKHFLPTPEELGLLGPPPPGPNVWPEPGHERGTHLTSEDTEA